MPESRVNNAVCEKCGVDVRENTAFCYNCGNAFATESDISVVETNGKSRVSVGESIAALDDLASRLSLGEATDSGKLAEAAAKRKKARVNPRRSKEFVWEPLDENSGKFAIVLAVVIGVLTLGVVFLTVLWR